MLVRNFSNLVGVRKLSEHMAPGWIIICKTKAVRRSLTAASAGNPSTVNHIFSNIKGSTRRRSHINAPNVGKPSVGGPTSLVIRECTRKRNSIVQTGVEKVTSVEKTTGVETATGVEKTTGVEKISGRPPAAISPRACPLWRKLSCVGRVGKLLLRRNPSLTTREATRARDCTDAGSVRKSLRTGQTLSLISSSMP